jgi:hypothetical protein
MSLSEQVRAAIIGCGQSVYRVAQEVRVEEKSLRKFLAGKTGLSMPALDRCAAYLGLIVSTPKRNPE